MRLEERSEGRKKLFNLSTWLTASLVGIFLLLLALQSVWSQSRSRYGCAAKHHKNYNYRQSISALRAQDNFRINFNCSQENPMGKKRCFAAFCSARQKPLNIAQPNCDAISDEKWPNCNSVNFSVAISLHAFLRGIIRRGNKDDPKTKASLVENFFPRFCFSRSRRDEKFLWRIITEVFKQDSWARTRSRKAPSEIQIMLNRVRGGI